VPREIPFQGALQDGGAPVATSTSVTFRLFEAASGGTAIWTETQTVTPDADGAFAVRLGAGTALPGDLGGPLWLELTVPSGGGSQVLGPRTALGAAPYALGLYGLTVTPNASGTNPTYGPNLVGGSPANTVGTGVGGATISGGGGTNNRNRVTADFGAVGGGGSNTASGTRSTVGGGLINVASGSQGTVGGGFGNTASGLSSTVGGGSGNTASGLQSTVGGGNTNTASGVGSIVPGGTNSQARGSYSFAAGFLARAVHNGAFVWSDDSQSDADSLVSTGPGQFLIRAAGGVGIGTNRPLAALHIEGADKSLLSSALQGEEVIVEAEDAVVGLYSSAGGTWGSALAFGEVNGTGAITNKWGIARRTGSTGALFFTFGAGSDYSSNDAQMRIETNGDVRADGSFVGGGADLAEFFPLATSGTGAASVRPGDLVGLRGGHVSRATEAAEQVMIASSDPAFVGNPDAEAGGALVALVGQAEVRLAGPASVGDLLVASGQEDGTARAVAPEAYAPEVDGPVAGRVLALSEAGRAMALVGVDEAAALRTVVARQADEIEALRAGRVADRARHDAQQAQIDALTRRLDALTATAEAR
ncbi:MAG: hypothetical protein AAGJ11_02190, partial [Bacteroidota bacterium]